MMALSDLPVVTIDVRPPPGPVETWTDAALIEFVDAYDARLDELTEYAVIDESFLLWSLAWVELSARTDPIGNQPWICAHCQVEFPNYRAKEAHRATLAWVRGA